jgi:hypothetical protein
VRNREKEKERFDDRNGDGAKKVFGRKNDYQVKSEGWHKKCGRESAG